MTVGGRLATLPPRPASHAHDTMVAFSGESKGASQNCGQFSRNVIDNMFDWLAKVDSEGTECPFIATRLQIPHLNLLLVRRSLENGCKRRFNCYLPTAIYNI